MKSILTLLVLTIFVTRECRAVKINKFSVPSVFDLHDDEKKDQPLILECDYETEEGDSGIVLKWLFNGKTIYQWIPNNNPMPFALKGPFKTRIDLEYNNELPPAQRYNSLVIKEPMILDSGNYSCDIQSFKNGDRKTSQMSVVYVDESIQLNYNIDNDEVNFECVINQIFPLPEVTLLIGDEIRNFTSNSDGFFVNTDVYHNVNVTTQINKKDIEDDAEVACIVKIPEINFERKTVINYDENNGFSIRANVWLSLFMCVILSIIKSEVF